ncbi:MAG: flagellar basal body P-ring formation chaperone FlgA [Candidatus Auribacterota bacterium]|jgi:flagella basal body P-ring formation protein FlgA|uniref:Flagella basal body P-ring formation protein FlgA n=1 Tax=Candidatus Auribacter fodinae TaxID=2093366 RepID=A0A3A4R900_9BACT|nr:MAG: flagella basal body P-ring formation protein FlgA [Candidatus Auribacter fodinae]
MVNRWFLSIISFLLVPVLSGIAQAEGIIIELKKEVQLASQEFTIGDIATITGAQTPLADMIGRIPMGKVPEMETAKRNITPAEIIYRLGQEGIEAQTISFSGAEVSTIKPQLQPVLAEDLVTVVETFIRETMPWSEEEVIIEPIRMPETVEVCLGAVTVEVVPVSKVSYIGQVRYSVIISVDGRVQKSVDVFLRVRVFKDVLVASRNIKRGEMFSPANIMMAKRELQPSSQDALSDPRFVLGMVATRSISAQKIIKDDFVDMPVIVHRRELVQVLYKHENFQIETVGVAKEDGCVGQFIRIQNTDSKKLFFARVVGVRTVEIEAQENLR